MLETLQFIFSSFWVWLGTLILLMAIRGKTLAKIRTTKLIAKEKINHGQNNRP